MISNAGVAFSASVESLPPEGIERIFAVNTSGTLPVTQAVLPAMRERGGPPLADDPYAPALKALAALRSTPMTPEEVATAVADVIENPDAPFRVAVGSSVQPLIEAHDSIPCGELFDIAAAARA